MRLPHSEGAPHTSGSRPHADGSELCYQCPPLWHSSTRCWLAPHLCAHAVGCSWPLGWRSPPLHIGHAETPHTHPPANTVTAGHACGVHTMSAVLLRRCAEAGGPHGVWRCHTTPTGKHHTAAVPRAQLHAATMCVHRHHHGGTTTLYDVSTAGQPAAQHGLWPPIGTPSPDGAVHPAHTHTRTPAASSHPHIMVLAVAVPAHTCCGQRLQHRCAGTASQHGHATHSRRCQCGGARLAARDAAAGVWGCSPHHMDVS